MPIKKLNFTVARKTIVPLSRRAAQYVRMSTDQQRYSIQNQKETIARYALSHDITIVRTYVDAGRSGLKIETREAISQLISDVRNGHADFNVILVFDVSRWGRFQDVDESAYYEFICKLAGVPVEYCDEAFENDGSIYATLFKGMKRAMAGEYSRELSARISSSHHKFARLGFSQGGLANYGLGRVLVDYAGRPKMPLLDRQQKNLRDDHVILAPGPKHEVETVREIFRMFVTERLPQRRIARILNQKKIFNRRGNPWSGTNICNILTNEKYIGTFVYNRTSWRLQTKRVYHPKDQWIRVEGAIEPIIDQKLFDSAQLLITDKWALSDNDLLDYLTAAWCVSGYLSAGKIDEMKHTPCVTTYHDRFGGLAKAYALIGYKATHIYHYTKIAADLRLIERDLICRLISNIEQHGGTVQYDEELHTLCVDGEFTISPIIIPYYANRFQGPGWKLFFSLLPRSNFFLLVRLNKKNAKVLDYHVFPRPAFARPSFRFTDKNISQLKSYKLDSLAKFFTHCQALHQGVVSCAMYGEPQRWR